MHTFRLRPLPCRCLRTSLLLTYAAAPRLRPRCMRTPRFHTYLTAAGAHLPAAAQRMRTPPPLHVYPAAAYAPSPLLLGHPAPLLLNTEWVLCCRSIAHRHCMRTRSSPYAPLQPVRPAAACTPAARLSRRCPSCTPPLPTCSMCTSLMTYPTTTRTPSTPPRPAVACRHSCRTA
ncbi:hypothetical protein DFH08DRAFT_950971 [Mycena albidolilacea]|uniref:Uncharacterized protein n=1 Tax=Mycena albidolilacea TaxID=1033008 RepID=A0AAD7ANE2_9AGAR|nr:hypothetical protein DFH08DRAFT_950971 [Mycena albidolilacea]